MRKPFFLNSDYACASYQERSTQHRINSTLIIYIFCRCSAAALAQSVSAYAAIIGTKIVAVNKLKTYHIKGQRDDLRVNRTSDGLWIHDASCPLIGCL